MKNIYVLFFFLICGFASGQIVNIPDANFKNALLTTYCADFNNDGLPDGDADTNNDGEIQVSEAQAVYQLTLNYQGISSLEGIQSFSNLEWLSCNNNNLSTLFFKFFNLQIKF